MLSRARKILGNEYVLGVFFLTASGFVANILNYFFNLLAARLLGPNGYGEISALFSYLYIFSIPTTVISIILIKKIGAKGQSSLQFTRSLEKWFWLKISKIWPLIILVPIASLFVPRLANLSIATGYLLLPLIFLTFVASFYAAELQGLKQFLPFAVIGIIAALVKFLGAFLNISIFSRLGTISVFVLFSTFLCLVAYWLVFHFLLRSKKTGPLVLDKKIGSIVKDKEIWFVAFSVLGMTLLNNIDVIFVKQFFPAGSAGLYSAWSLFAKIIFYVVGPLSSVVFVFLARNKSNSSNQRFALILSLLILLLIATVAFLSYFNFPGLIIGIFFGSQFTAISPLLASATLFGFFYSAINLLNSYFVIKQSRIILVLPVLIPVYMITLYFLNRNIESVMDFSILFSAIIALVYFLAFLKSIKQAVYVQTGAAS